MLAIRLSLLPKLTSGPVLIIVNGVSIRGIESETMTGLQYDKAATEQLEAIYKTPDVAGQRARTGIRGQDFASSTQSLARRAYLASLFALLKALTASDEFFERS